MKRKSNTKKKYDPENRKKGEPIFGRTPFGSKNGYVNTDGFKPPVRKWDSKGLGEGVEI